MLPQRLKVLSLSAVRTHWQTTVMERKGRHKDHRNADCEAGNLREEGKYIAKAIARKFVEPLTEMTRSDTHTVSHLTTPKLKSPCSASYSSRYLLTRSHTGVRVKAT